jgi:hypothetical protein
LEEEISVKKYDSDEDDGINDNLKTNIDIE